MVDDLHSLFPTISYERVLISFFYQRAKVQSIVPEFSEISCTGMAIFAISLLLLT